MSHDKNKQIAIFRFGVIHEFVGGASLTAGQRSRLMREKSQRKWVIPFSARTRISKNTIYRWIRRYQDSGGNIESLYPMARTDAGTSRKLDKETLAVIITARDKQPDLPVPLLLADLKRRCLVPQTTGLTTIYRLLHRHNLMDKTPANEDRRKFEARLPNDIWQSDVMHGPKVMVDQKLRKTYLIAFIDDHSRLIVHADFYLSENLAAFMDAFEKALAKRGVPRKLYVDNGAAYRSRKLEFTCASLAVALIHARPYKPQGKGKIERFFRTVRAHFLPFARTATVGELNKDLHHWLDHVYHQRKHSGTGATPFDRFTRNLACIRCAPKNLTDYFRKAVYRTVAKDRTISLANRLFEAPVVLIGKRVLCLYHEDDPGRLEVMFNQQSYGFLTPLDLHINCRIKRDNNKITQIESTTPKSYKAGVLWK